jgi:ATP-dependent protease ClpP protease subunit
VANTLRKSQASHCRSIVGAACSPSVTIERCSRSRVRVCAAESTADHHASSTGCHGVADRFGTARKARTSTAATACDIGGEMLSQRSGARRHAADDATALAPSKRKSSVGAKAREAVTLGQLNGLPGKVI